jgi:hypothetical protein
LLHWLSETTDQYLALSGRQIYNNTELKLEEIPYIVGLWLRGHGQNLIAKLTHVELSRIRSIYRSLEETYARKNISATSKPLTDISNQLWQWFVAHAKTFRLNDTVEVYIIEKDPLEAKVLELELARMKSPITEPVTPASPPLPYLEEISPLDLPLDPPTPRERVPEITDPLAEYHGTPPQSDLPPAEPAGENSPAREDSSVQAPSFAELEKVRQLDVTRMMSSLPPLSQTESLRLVRRAAKDGAKQASVPN